MALVEILLVGCGGSSPDGGQADTLAVVVDSASEEEAYDPWAFSSYRDTLMMIDGKALGWALCEGCEFGCYTYDGRTLVDDPTARIDSLSPSRYALSILGHYSLEFDPSDAACIGEMQALDSPIEGFSRFSQRYDYPVPTVPSDWRVHYFFTVDYPNAGLKPCERGQREEVCQWLSGHLGTLFMREACDAYEPSLEGMNSLGIHLADGYFSVLLGDWPEDEPVQSGLYFKVDARARLFDGRFVTYCLYVSWNNDAYWHGFYSMSLISYDLVSHQPITNDYLFKPERMDEVKHALYVVMGLDKHYTEGERLTAEEVKDRVADWRGGPLDELPPAGLSSSGFVFSFQPYEIGCFAAGSYHFTVPYDDVEDCLTPQAKALL